MKNVSVKQRLYLLSALGIVAFLITMLVSVSALESNKDGVHRIYDDRVVPMKLLKTIADEYAVSVIDAVNKAANGLMTASEARQAIQTAQKNIHDSWDVYLSTALTPEEQSLVNEAKQLFGQADGAIAGLLSSTSGASDGSAFQRFNGDLYQDIDPISNKITELIDLQLRVAEEETERVDEKFAAMLGTFIISAIVVILFMVAFAHWIIRSITGPLDCLKNLIKKVQNTGNLSLRANNHNSDEVAEVSQTFDAFMEEFGGIITEVENACRVLSDQASSLDQMSTRGSQSVEKQLEEADAVAAASEEMSQSISGVADNASSASSSADEARNRSQSGGDILLKTITAIDRLSVEISSTGEVISEVEQGSHSIGTVLEVIRSIAEQTNLLALNAAIEAARAGEQGRGFAVVADEVRTLAQRTQESTEEIDSMIGQLQTATKNAVEQTEGVRKSIGETQEMADGGRAAIEGILESVNQIRDMNSQIAVATEEQASASKDITHHIINVRDRADGEASDMAAMKDQSDSMSGLVSQLKQHVARFTVSA